MIYLDNAATSFPKPRAVTQAMYKAASCYANASRGSYFASAAAGKVVFETRNKIAELFGTEAENIVFTKNCTESLNTAIKGMLKKGDHVIISSLEHNSVLRPVEKLFEKGIITYSIAKVDPQNDSITLNSFKSLIRPNTKLIVCTHVSNVFGTVLPISEIGALAKKYGICFIVDAAQSAGTFDINLINNDIDILCMPGHKGLLGPMGTGVMILNTKKIPDSFIEGGTGSLSLEKHQPDFLPDKFESGTLNIPGIAGISAGLDVIKSYGGISAIYEHEKELTDIFVNDAASLKNVRVYKNMHGSLYAPVVSFSVGKMHSEQVAEKLSECGIAIRAGYHCSYLAHKTCNTQQYGTVRVSPGLFSVKKDIKYLTFCIKKIENN